MAIRGVRLFLLIAAVPLVPAMWLIFEFGTLPLALYCGFLCMIGVWVIEYGQD